MEKAQGAYLDALLVAETWDKVAVVRNRKVTCKKTHTSTSYYEQTSTRCSRNILRLHRHLQVS